MKQKVKSCSLGDYKKRIFYYGGSDERATVNLSGDLVEELSTCDDDTDSSELDAVSNTPCETNDNPKSLSTNLLVGDVVWAKCSGHNWWPSMIAYDPTTAVYFHMNARNTTPQKYHVQFFGSRPFRGWVPKSNIISFTGMKYIKVVLHALFQFFFTMYSDNNSFMFCFSQHLDI